MPACRSCGYSPQAEPGIVGSRCPRCRKPLYEAPLASAGGGRGRDAETMCAVHPANGAMGTCGRCGTFFCAVCRSQWYGANLCVNCFERIVEAGELTPTKVRRQRIHAFAALGCGLAAWVVLIVGFVILTIAAASGDLSKVMVVVLLGVMAFAGSVAFSIVGAGLGASAIRNRGYHMLPATAGMVLSGLHLGLFLGFCLVSFWSNL